MSLKNGDLLNQRYRIVDVLGQGGMGAVYRAVDENLDITVAVKENAFFSEEYARQFQREAKVLASLRHQNLPRVFDYFVIDQQGQYLVMDYIEGDDLRQWISHEEDITEFEVLQIGIAICNALIYLHTRNPAVIHRDIKPGNVKITPEGEVVLVDFGLVKLMQEGELTTTAARAMTPGYSPPEQYGNEPTDHRSDIYSLGATLYTALAGYLPEDSLSRTTGKSRLTPLRDYNPIVSRQTGKAIQKALKLRFEDRWQSVGEFREALLEVQRSMPVEQQTSHRLARVVQTEPEMMDGRGAVSTLQKLRDLARLKEKKTDPVWIIFGVVTLFLLVSLIVFMTQPDGLLGWVAGTRTSDPSALHDGRFTEPSESHAADPASTQTREVESTPIHAVGNNETPFPSPTPLGGGIGEIAFVSERTGIPQIWLIDVTTRQVQQLTDLSDGACQPDWSPDGTKIVFTSPCAKKRERYPGSSLYLLEIESRELTPLPASLEGDFDPAWSSDGQWIAYTSLINGQLQLMKLNLDDYSVIRLSDGTYDDFQPAWSPTGDRLVFVRIRGIGQIWLMDANGGNAVQFSRSGSVDNSVPKWYPKEDLILYSQAFGPGSPNTQIYGMRLDDIGQSEEYLILPSVRSEFVQMMDNVDLSPDGYWLAFDYWYYNVLSDIYIMAFPGANLLQLTEHPEMDFDPVWRPVPLDEF